MRSIVRGAYVGCVILGILVVTGCPSPVSPSDSAERNFDLDPPIEPSDGGPPIADPYDTQPQWSWSPSGGGTGFFRVRINGDEWIEGVTSPYPNPAIDFYPGTYVFEVQERDGAGNWSEVTSQTTTINVREPSFNASETGDIQNRQPSFGWDPYAPAQFGATGRFLYQLERNDGAEWVVIDSESQSDTTDVAYTISSPLPDATYRFGVSEWNDGGARSDFTYANFRVDNVAPPAPNVTAPASLYGLSDSVPFTFTSNDGSSAGFTWRIVDGTLPTDPEFANSGGIPDPSGSYVAPAFPTPSVYTIFVTDYDTAGNVSSAGSFTFTVEDIPSIARNFFPAGTVTNDDPSLFDVTPSGVATSTNYQYRLNGGSWVNAIGDAAIAWSLSLPLPGDGAYTIDIRQELAPASGTYTSPSVAVPFTVDQTAPTAPSIVSAIPTYNNTDTITFTVSGEPFATFPIDITGDVNGLSSWSATDADGNGSETFTQNGFLDDRYTIVVQQTDQAGNTSIGSAPEITTLDTVAPAAPTIATATPLDGVPTAINSITLDLTFEAETTVVWSSTGANVDSGEQSDAGNDGAETLSLTGLSDGTTNVAILVRDRAGNEGTSVTYTGVLDTVPPAVPSFDPGNPTFTNDTQPTLTFSGPAGETIDYVLESVATGLPVPGESGTGVDLTSYTVGAPFLADGSDDGDYRLVIKSVDAAGNESSTVAWTFTLDTQAPSAPTGVASSDLEGVPGAYYVTTSTPAFTWTGSGEPGGTFEYSVDGGTTVVGPINSGDPIASIANGPGYDFRVREVDNAGNVSPWTGGTVFEVVSSGSGTITITNPTVPSFSFDNEGFTLDRTAAETINVVVTAVGVTVDSYQWLINGVDQGVNADNFVVDSTGGDVFLGSNTLTLVVDVGGSPYSEDFFFTVVQP